MEQIRLSVKENYTRRIISDTLKQSFPEVMRGFSKRSIPLFCSQHKIQRSDLEVKSIVEDSIREVCIKMHIHNLSPKNSESKKRSHLL